MSGEERVVVVGGGMAGLAAAWRLHKAGVPVTLLERSERVGGVVGTLELGGHSFERGPTTVMDKPGGLATVIDGTGLRERVVVSRDDAHRRLVWRKGALHELPGGPGGLLGTPLMSLRGRLRVLAEPFTRRRPADAGDETLRAFLTRHIGAEAVEAFADPFVAGVYAGDLDTLGADAFPMLLEVDREHGSLVRGLIARRKASRKAGDAAPPRKPGRTPLVSFPRGLTEIPETIHQALGTRVRLGHDVYRVEPQDGGWLVHALVGERQVEYEARAVVLAAPAFAAAALLKPLDEAAAPHLEAIPHPHVSRIGLGYARDAVEHPLDAFGLLAASGSPLPSGDPFLGILFTSSIFDGRAPEGHVTLDVLLGGTRDPSAAALSDTAAVQRARRAVEQILGARGEPTAVAVSRWARAIPQYTPGHVRRMAEVRERLAAFPGLVLAGNYLEGVGLDPTAGSGLAAAEALLS